MALSLTEKSELVSSFWKDRPSACPKHEIPMRTFFVERVYKPQIVMVCPKGEMFRWNKADGVRDGYIHTYRKVGEDQILTVLRVY